MTTINDDIHARPHRGYKRDQRDNTLAWIIGIVLALGVIFAVIYSVNAVSNRDIGGTLTGSTPREVTTPTTPTTPDEGTSGTRGTTDTGTSGGTTGTGPGTE